MKIEATVRVDVFDAQGRVVCSRYERASVDPGDNPLFVGGAAEAAGLAAVELIRRSLVAKYGEEPAERPNRSAEEGCRVQISRPNAEGLWVGLGRCILDEGHDGVHEPSPKRRS